MTMTRAQRQYLFLGWSGITLTWIVSLVLEVLLFGDRALLFAAITTALAVGVGMEMTRRAVAPHRRAAIKVGDLRVRRVRRRSS